MRLSRPPQVAILGAGLCLFVSSACDDGGTLGASRPDRSVATASTATSTTGPSIGLQDIGLRLDLEAADLQDPVLVTNAGDGSEDLFVVEQTGAILRMRSGRAPEMWLDIGERIIAGGEQGLLGLAFHPAYERNGRFYVNYTDLEGDTVIAEYHSANDRADPSTERILFTVDQPFANHNGGNIVFGPDGLLYIGMGDGGAAADPDQRAQDPKQLLGKMLTYDVDAEGEPRIWASGLRNPWRFSFDRETGDLWIGDVGQGDLEEIDRLPAGSPPGTNFGWDTMEGDRCFEPLRGCDSRGLHFPVAVYNHDEGCSVTGGFVYRGTDFSDLQGVYLFADYCSGTIWGLDAAGPDEQDPVVLLRSEANISSFGEDEMGELYLSDHQGNVFRVLSDEK